VAIHHIALQKQTNDLVMGTHGRGIIIIDDISPLRNIGEEQLASKLHFFEPTGLVMRDKSYGFPESFGTETQFVGENPTRIAQFKYLLPKRHTFGKMTMEVQDMEGNKVATLNPKKLKGINTVSWNYSMRQPKVAKGKTLAFGGFTSPRVAAGDYKVVIKKGRDTFEKVFRLENDYSTNTDPAYFKAKYELTMQLYNMTQELAYMVYQLDALMEQVKSKRIKGELQTLKESLVITTGDNYVGAAEPQLREKMASLYSKVAESYSKPSPNEIEYFEVINDRFLAAKTNFEKLEKKSKVDLSTLKSYDTFINE
jgi:hypothetical protein